MMSWFLVRVQYQNKAFCESREYDSLLRTSQSFNISPINIVQFELEKEGPRPRIWPIGPDPGHRSANLLWWLGECLLPQYLNASPTPFLL